jgi:23S rRNA (cytidine1920-2'-O)/16S rRNA (cytidine1409-2'-O)-methyltransferase
VSRKRGKPRALLGEIARLYPELEDPGMAIARGRVLVNGFPVTNVAARVPADASLRLRVDRPLRGSAKLRAALDAFAVSVVGRTAVDVGAAAGGFTRVLLEAGAERVYAVDVGYGQLVGSLRRDERVVVLERVNVAELAASLVPEVVEIIAIDVSYLGVAAVAPQLEALRIDGDADCIALVKPMYELQLARPPADDARLQRAVDAAARGLAATGWHVAGAIRSPELGSRGAVEFLLHASRAPRGSRRRGGA